MPKQRDIVHFAHPRNGASLDFTMANQNVADGDMLADTQMMAYQLGGDPMSNLPFTPTTTSWTFDLSTIISATGVYTMTVHAWDINGGATDQRTFTVTKVS